MSLFVWKKITSGIFYDHLSGTVDVLKVSRGCNQPAADPVTLSWDAGRDLSRKFLFRGLLLLCCPASTVNPRLNISVLFFVYPKLKGKRGHSLWSPEACLKGKSQFVASSHMSQVLMSHVGFESQFCLKLSKLFTPMFSCLHRNMYHFIHIFNSNLTPLVSLTTGFWICALIMIHQSVHFCKDTEAKSSLLLVNRQTLSVHLVFFLKTFDG